MTGIVLAHGKAAPTVERHMANWRALFPEIIIVSPKDDPFSESDSMIGTSERHGRSALDRFRFAMECGAARSGVTAILEYDTLFFRRFSTAQMNMVACSALRQDRNPIPGLFMPYGHSPWVATGETWRRVLAGAGDEQMGFPDRWLALACHNAGVALMGFINGFSDDAPWTPAARAQAALAVQSGAPAVHGCKTAEDFAALESAYKTRHGL